MTTSIGLEARWGTERWEESAREARARRADVNRALARKPSADLGENIQAMVELLSDVRGLSDHIGLFPSTQRALYRRMEALCYRIGKDAFPLKRRKVPAKEAIRFLYSQAKGLLGVDPVVAELLRAHRNPSRERSIMNAFYKKRRLLAELWIEARMPPDAGQAEIDRALKACQEIMIENADFRRPTDDEERHADFGKKAHLSTPPSVAARKLVAALFGVSHTTIKKELGKKARKPTKAKARTITPPSTP